MAEAVEYSQDELHEIERRIAAREIRRNEAAAIAAAEERAQGRLGERVEDGQAEAGTGFALESPTREDLKAQAAAVYSELLL
jgi:hypothetical protein